MKLFITLTIMLSVLSACNFKEGLKETGDAITEGTENVIEAVKEMPADISKASNKVEAEIRE